MVRRPFIRLLIVFVAAVFAATLVLLTPLRGLVNSKVWQKRPHFINACNHPPTNAVQIYRERLPHVQRRTFMSGYGTPTCEWSLPYTDAPSSVLLGVVTSVSRFSKRRLIRNTYARDARDSTRIVFVVGKQNWESEMGRALAAEARMYGDIMELDIEENGDLGKTHAFYLAVNKVFWACRFTYVAKVDDDVWFHLPHLEARLDKLADHAVTKGVYYGALLSWKPDFHYMAGMITALSWNIVEWITKDPFPEHNSWGPEDVKTGEWVQRFGQQRAEALGNPLKHPFHINPVKCPSGKGYPHYECEPREMLWDGDGDKMTAFNKDTVVGLHRMKEDAQFCQADALLGPR
ncbi:hypothetical protein HDU86_003029 [Geranomyces michiganensis]|nr:hypothetical protein HDU86_003029 [Geranomyces michiganensis]